MPDQPKKEPPQSNRVPFEKRVMSGEWTPFESHLFNLVTKHVQIPGFFSTRLRVAQAMMDAMDAEIAVITAERAANNAEAQDA